MTGIDTSNWQQYAAPCVHAEFWTAIVPAAGRGTRLGSDLPKILYPIAGRTILEWLLGFLEPACRSLVFVLSPSGRTTVEKELERLVPGKYRTVIQEAPRGMGDAVDRGLAAAGTPYAAVVWGDQAALRSSTVEACMRLHEGALRPDITFPTLLRPDPYIHFERGTDGCISALRQAREGDMMPQIGETDTGFFCFDTGVLRRLLDQLRESASAGNQTGEFNLLPVIPLAAQAGFRIITPRLVTVEETVGVNSPSDAAVVEKFLVGRFSALPRSQGGKAGS